LDYGLKFRGSVEGKILKVISVTRIEIQTRFAARKLMALEPKPAARLNPIRIFFLNTRYSLVTVYTRKKRFHIVHDI